MRRIHWLLAIPFLLCVSYLVLGEKPWNGTLDKISADLAAGEKPDWQDDVVLGLYGAAAINALLCLLLFATARFWTRPVRLRATAGAGAPAATGLGPRLFWSLVLAAVVLAGGLRWNFARGSLWWDEIWNARQAVVGQWKPSKDPGAPPKFAPSTYARAAWYYQKPTNHIPAALASKVSHDWWAKSTGAAPGAIAEFPYRLPNLLLSLGSVVAIGVLVRRWGFAGGGAIAAFLLAVHPWAIRYGVDMRAYSGLILLTILGCLWITRIAQSGGAPWRYWLLFGLNQFLLVWALPNAVWYAMGFFIALALVTLRRGGGWNGLSRLLAVNVFAAMALFAVGAPPIVQAYRWIQDLYQPHLITPELLRTTASELFYGMPWFWSPSRESEGLPSLLALTGGSVGPGMFAAWALPLVLIALGLYHVLRSERSSLAGIAAIGGATLFYLWFTYSREELFYPRYIIYLLVPFVALLAVGIDVVSRRIIRRNAAGAVALALLVGAGGFAAFVSPSIRLLSTRSYAPFREVADWLHTHVPEGGRVFGHGLGGREVDAYYPAIGWNAVSSEENLRSAIDAAARDGVPFHVVYGYPGFNRATFPEASAVLDDPRVFEEVAAFPGIEPEFFFRILRPRPASAVSADGS